ncbi:hypothetical protein C7212DRAFT_308760, partial [Tuber magnatum]
NEGSSPVHSRTICCSGILCCATAVQYCFEQCAVPTCCRTHLGGQFQQIETIIPRVINYEVRTSSIMIIKF